MAGMVQRPDGQRIGVIAGGWATNIGPSFAYDTVAFFYPDTLSWASGTPMPGGRYGASAVQYR